MTISPHHLTIGQLFQQNFIFRVPKYQRYYAWDEEQIDDFLKDLEACIAARRAGGRKHHFLGGIVTVTTPSPGTVRRNVEVIDGQQRLATLTILAHELSRAMKALAGDVDATAVNSPKAFLETSAATLWRQYESFQDAVALNMVEVARLELSKPDKDFFAQMLDDAAAAPAITRTSHDRLARARNRIRAKIADLLAGGSDIDRAGTLSFVAEVLANDWTVIHMGADQRDEAYMLFQVLNDRGTSLTEGELLRSRTLEMLDGGGTPQQSQMVEDAWDKILTGKPDDIGEGLRWIYSSYEARRPGKTTLYDDFLASRYPAHSVGQLNPAQARAVVAATQSIKADFDRMADILDGRWPYAAPVPQVTTWDKDRLRLLIPELRLLITMPLLIPTSALDQPTFAKVVHLVERFMYRYKIVVNARSSPPARSFSSTPRSPATRPPRLTYHRSRRISPPSLQPMRRKHSSEAVWPNSATRRRPRPSRSSTCC